MIEWIEGAIKTFSFLLIGFPFEFLLVFLLGFLLGFKLKRSNKK
jgi:hypothetical protein